MMIDLINELESKNIYISLKGDKLELSYDDEIDNEVVEKIKENKEGLVKFLHKYSGVKKYEEIKSVEEQSYYPLSDAQKRLWMLSQFEKDSLVWNMPVIIHFNGACDYTIFKKTMQSVVQRHEILRTTFQKNEDGQVCQRIMGANEFGFQLKYEDFSLEENSKEIIQNQIEKDKRRVFNLEKGPLVRAILFKALDEEYVFYLNIHHIISDGWSLEVLEKDIKIFYQAHNTGNVLNIPKLKIQYKDYANWQLNQSKEGSIHGHKNYWLKELSGELPVIDLPHLKLRPKILTHNGFQLRTFLGKDLTRELKLFHNEQGGSLFTNLLAVWNVLFYRYLNQKDIIIGTLVAGREHSELENQIGYYVNTLALRNKINPEESFIDFYDRVKEKTLESFSHQIFPFNRLTDELSLIRDRSTTPIFEVLLVLHNIKENKKQYKELNQNDINCIHNIGEVYSKFPLEIEFKELGDYISFDIKFNTDIYCKKDINNLIKYYKRLLVEIIENPYKKIHQINFLADDEQEKLLYEFNRTEVSYDKNKSIIRSFEDQVGKTPEKIAIIYKENRLTYKELNTLSNKYAEGLQEIIGLESGNRIVVSLDHDQNLMPVLLAIKKIGAIYVPVDPRMPKNKINEIKGLSESITILNIDTFLEIKEYSSKISCINTNWVQSEQSDIEFIIYTSGSTGKPKGVLLKPSSVNNRLNWMWSNYPFKDGEVCCAKTSISFVDHIWEFFGPLLKGIPLVFYKKNEVLNIPDFIESLAQEKVSRIVLVPSLLRAILNYSELCEKKLNNLNTWISSGEALKKSDVDLFYNTLNRSNVRLLNIYGSTEVTADATYYDTYWDYNQKKTFNLFESSIKQDIEKLISFHDTNKKIVSNSLENLIENNEVGDITLEPKGDLNDYVQFLKNQVIPNTVNVASSNYIGHMTGPVPKFVRELASLVTVLNQNQVKIETSMMATLIEKEVIGTFHKLVYEKSKHFYDQYALDPIKSLGVITNGGTMSNIMVLNYVLNNLLKPRKNFIGIRKEGLVKAMKFYGYEKIVLLGSKWCHYSFGKSLKMMGLGLDSFVSLDFEDKKHDIIKEELRYKIEELNSENTLILGLVGIAGTTESGNIEPLRALGEIATEYNIHYHVDAAFGGSFLMDDELKKKFEGIQLADSVSICAHKQLYVPIGLSLCLFKDPDFTFFSENNTHYQARKGSYDLGRFTIEGSRNFMSLILHGILHVYGKEGFAEVVRYNYSTAQCFAKLIKDSKEFKLMYEPDLNIILYRYIPLKYRGIENLSEEDLNSINEINRAIQKEQFNSGKSFVSFTEIKMKDKNVRQVALRAVFMNPFTEAKNLEVILEEQKAIAAKIENIPETKNKFYENENVPIGKPIANVKVYIIDEFLNVLPIGIKGEICISGDCVSAGYVNESVESSSKFILNPFEKNEYLFKTGDLGKRLIDGNIEFITRKDDQVKIRGHRIELKEIESALLSIEGINSVVVITRKVKLEEAELIAYVVSDNKISDLRINLMKDLPSYMIPSYLVHLDSFPLTISGKVDKKALPNPEGANLLNDAVYESPKNEMEYQIINIWEEVLKRERIGMKDDFFSLGGHSLKATNLINEYEKAFEVKLNLNEIFLNTTVESHLSLIKEAPISSISTIQKIIKQESYPISDTQQRLWVLSQLEKGHGTYNMPFEIEFEEDLDIILFQKAIKSTIQRHEILRTIFKENEKGEIRQWILVNGADNFEMNYFDYTGDNYGCKKAKHYIKEDSYKPFDLKKGPLLRVSLIRLNEEKFILYYNMHHIISDGISLEILRQDTLTFYEAYLSDEIPNILPLEIQYKDYTSWRLERLKSDQFKAHKTYWINRLSGKLPRLNFVEGKKRPKIKTHSGNSLTTYISADLKNALKEFCFNYKGSLFIGTLTIWKILFHKYTSQRDIVVGTPEAGRGHKDLKNQIGCYFNTLVLRNEIDPNDSFVDIFNKIKKSFFKSFNHKEYPFDKIIEDLKVRREINRNPMFDIMFSFHNTGENRIEQEIDNVDAIIDNGFTQSKLDMLINFAEHGRYIYMNIDYDIEIYDKSFIIELMISYKNILKEIVSNPNRAIKNIDFRKGFRKDLKETNRKKLVNLIK